MQPACSPANLQSTTPKSRVADRLFARSEEIRAAAATGLDPKVRSQLGQFLTPGRIASVLSSCISTRRRELRILDPGAGSGALCANLVATLIKRRTRPDAVCVTAFEIDDGLVDHLRQTLRECEMACQQLGVRFESEIEHQDYIEAKCTAAKSLFHDDSDRYSCVIMNPPYRKIHSASATRQQLRSLGIETSNLYTAFMLLAARQLEPNGEFVSINPRSFCNGPYFRPFRREFLKLISIRRVHVFESRSDAFRDDDVLQENVVVYGVRSSRLPGTVTISQTLSDGSITRRGIDPVQLGSVREVIVRPISCNVE